jgi:hypothetical protein
LEKHGLESCNTSDGFVSKSKTKAGSTSLWIQELKVSAHAMQQNLNFGFIS